MLSQEHLQQTRNFKPILPKKIFYSLSLLPISITLRENYEKLEILWQFTIVLKLQINFFTSAKEVLMVDCKTLNS